jgi:hypothetical protein
LDLEEIMSSKQIFIAAAVAALVTPSFADMPDGRHGRTSPQAAVVNGADVSPAKHCQRACPRRDVANSREIVTTPAEMKALGHLAWVRTTAPRQETACNKKPIVRTVQYPSPAELKAVGHLARPDVAPPAAEKACCEAGQCRKTAVS